MQDKINYDIQFYELELKRTKSKYRKRDLAKCIKRLKAKMRKIGGSNAICV